MSKCYRIDKITLEFVNCPLGVKTIDMCNKCFMNKGRKSIGVISDGIICEYEEVKNKIKEDYE